MVTVTVKTATMTMTLLLLLLRLHYPKKYIIVRWWCSLRRGGCYANAIVVIVAAKFGLVDLLGFVGFEIRSFRFPSSSEFYANCCCCLFVCVFV